MPRGRYSPRTHANVGSIQAGVYTDTAGVDLTPTFTELNQMAGLDPVLSALGVTGAEVQGGAGAAGGAATLTRLIVKKTGIADNTATALITVTVPNDEHAAAIRLTLLGSLGTGTDTFESSRCAEGLVVVARKAGVNAVAVAATLALAQIATTAGGGTLTLAYAVSAIAGAVGAVNTFNITVTLVATGTITDLQCVAYAELLNAEASGITMAAAA